MSKLQNRGVAIAITLVIVVLSVCLGAVRSIRSESMPRLWTEEGLPQVSVKAAVTAATASAQGFVVAELSR